MLDFLNNTFFVLVLRILTIFAAVVVLGLSVRSLRKRRRCGYATLLDYTILIVGVMWAAFVVYQAITISIGNYTTITISVFVMRFGLLLTLSVMISLLKERDDVAELTEILQESLIKIELAESENRSDVPG